MSLYRKKPVVISAVQFTQEMLEAHLFDGAPLPDGLTVSSWDIHREDRKIWRARVGVTTLEGFMTAEIGDWIITGVKGEHYPCKPDIFAATYEPVSPSDGRHSAMSEWISARDRLPSCGRKPGSFGVEVLVHPALESGERTAFYGRRVTDKPNFYKYGAVVSGVTHWKPLGGAPSESAERTEP